MTSRFSLSLISAAVAALSACSSVKQVRDEIHQKIPVAQRALETPLVVAEPSRVVERRGTRLTATEVAYSKDTGQWLKSIPVSLKAINPMTLSQVVAKLSANGINISSDLPLDNMSFVGVVNTTDADSALRQILGSSGLDFGVDDQRKLVTIKPLPTRTWNLPIGNRRSGFSSNADSNMSSTGSGSGSNSGVSGGGSSTGGSANSSQNGQSNSASSASGSTGSSGSQTTPSSSNDTNSGSSFSSNEDIWSSLEKELTKRLQVMIPATRTSQNSGQLVPNFTQNPLPTIPGNGFVQGFNPQQAPVPVVGGAMQGGLMYGQQNGYVQQPNGGQASNEMYVSRKLGTFSLNPETGIVYVQAPHWILNDLDYYFRRTADMLNTLVSFEGVLVLVSNNDSHSEAFDIQNFAKWASGRYGAVFSNNRLGGVTVNFPQGNIPSVSTGNATLGGPMLGVTSAKDGLAIFNEYMQQRGDTAIVQRPRLATTSGVPGEYSNLRHDFYTKVSQTATAGNSGAAMQATNTDFINTDFGTELKVYPRYDINTGLLRALIKMRTLVKDGERIVTQNQSVGGVIQSTTQAVPIPREMKASGEALLRDGDLIIVGGQTEENLSTSESGLPTGSGPTGGFLGSKSSSKTGGTYYFALKVGITPR